MEFFIENEKIKVRIQSKGAELTRIYNSETGLEYLWSGDPAFWGKTSPVLFPIVGTLKSDTYYFDDKSYQLSRHGFAREKEFSVVDQNAASIRFRLTDDEDTLNRFPFPFQFDILYVLNGMALNVSYEVFNTGAEPLYFSVGGHPAFKVPLEDGLSYDDYYLEFNSTEHAPRWPISPEGLIQRTPVPLLDHSNRLELSKALFASDALVFKNLQSDVVALRSTKGIHGLEFRFPGFPFLGVWAAKGADFVCIEPWCGIADHVDHDGQLTGKEGIKMLEPKERFLRTWSVTCF